MTSKFLLLALVSLLVAFSSCDKSKDDPTPKVPKIKTITHGTSSNSDKEYYEYDQSGRLKSITYTGHTSGNSQYLYFKDKIVWQSTFFPELDTLYLNEEGMVVSEMFGSITHEYDAKGYCVKTSGYGSGGEVDLEYKYKVSDENTTVLDVWEIVNEKLVYRITNDYEFLPNSNNTIGNENMGVSFYGKQNKNLLSASTQIYVGFNYPDQENYHYEKDAQNRVVKRWRERDPQFFDVYTYYE